MLRVLDCGGPQSGPLCVLPHFRSGLGLKGLHVEGACFLLLLWYQAKPQPRAREAETNPDGVHDAAAEDHDLRRDKLTQTLRPGGESWPPLSH